MLKGKETVKLSSLLGPESVCDGPFTAKGSARVDGVVNGDVRVEGTLILGTAGVINGNVYCEAIQAGGEINGNIFAPKHAELSSTAKVIGDLVTAVIVIDENAVFQGQISMDINSVSDIIDKNDTENDNSENIMQDEEYNKLLLRKKLAEQAVAEAYREAQAESEAVLDDSIIEQL